jgi:hypothetical protein
VTDSTLHYAMTRYLLRHAKPDDGVTIFRGPAASPVAVAGENIAMAPGESPVARFVFDQDGWILVTTKRLYYRRDGQLHRYDAETIKHVAMNIIPRVTKPTTLDEIRLSFSTGADAIIRGRAGMSINLLYVTVIRLVRGNRNRAAPLDAPVAEPNDDEKQISDGLKALFRL